MRVECQEFAAEHAFEIEPQDAQLSMGAELFDTIAARAAFGNAYSLRVDGRLVACGGVVETELGAHLWAVLAREAPMLVVHRAVRRFLSLFAAIDLHATVEAGFAPGCRWLEMLGFMRIGTFERFAAGVDHIHYIREATP